MIRVLLVDDSTSMRAVLRRFLRRKSLLTQTGPVADIQDDHHLGKPGV